MCYHHQFSWSDIITTTSVNRGREDIDSPRPLLAAAEQRGKETAPSCTGRIQDGFASTWQITGRKSMWVIRGCLWEHCSELAIAMSLYKGYPFLMITYQAEKKTPSEELCCLLWSPKFWAVFSCHRDGRCLTTCIDEVNGWKQQVNYLNILLIFNPIVSYLICDFF